MDCDWLLDNLIIFFQLLQETLTQFLLLGLRLLKLTLLVSHNGVIHTGELFQIGFIFLLGPIDILLPEIGFSQLDLLDLLELFLQLRLKFIN